MSSQPGTPSRITDYFPPSPSCETNEKKSKLKDEPVNIKQEPDELVEKLDLSNSSVILTPNHSPAKSEEDIKSEEPSQSEDTETSNTKTNSRCRKCLIQDVKEEDQPSEPSKQKIKGRRKKQNKQNTATTSASQPPTAQPRPKSSRKTQGKSESPSMKNTLVTDFFPVRRSERRCKSELEKEAEQDLHYKVLNGIEDGLQVEEISNKGRGVVSTKAFQRGEFVIEYAGDLMDLTAAAKREKKYSLDPSTGCYMYYFNFKNQKYCIDATAESGKLGRLLNHSKTSGNCHTKLVEVNSRPYLILVASRDISAGEELQYDYGDRSKEALESHPWLKC